MKLPFILFPVGYDPMVASGPPDEDGIAWTPEDTEKCKLMEYQVEEIFVEAEKFHPDDSFYRMKTPIIGRWSRQMTKEEFLATLPPIEPDYQI